MDPLVVQYHDLLAHVYRYRVTLRPVLARMLFNGRDADHALRCLREAHYLVSRPGPGGTAIYTLTRRGAALLGSDERGRKFGPQALHQHLSVLRFCFEGFPLRVRVDDDHSIRVMLGSDYSKVAHVAERGKNGTVLFNCYAPGETTRVKAVKRRTRHYIHAAYLQAEHRRMILDRRYGFVILVETEGRRKHLRKALGRPEPDGRGSLMQQARILVHVLEDPFAPSPDLVSGITESGKLMKLDEPVGGIGLPADLDEEPVVRAMDQRVGELGGNA